MAKKSTLHQTHKQSLGEYSFSGIYQIIKPEFKKKLRAAAYCSQRKMRVVLPENETENNELFNIIKNWSQNTWLRIRYFQGGSQGIWLIKSEFC